jgi:hypothetical protein
MVEPYSEEEKEYLRYLIRKYLPGIAGSSDKNVASIMYDTDNQKKSNTKNKRA